MTTTIPTAIPTVTAGARMIPTAIATAIPTAIMMNWLTMASYPMMKTMVYQTTSLGQPQPNLNNAQIMRCEEWCPQGA